MITTQQAIDYLRDPICEGLSTKEKLKLHEEAVAMAIKALKNFPTQMSGTSDLVNRQYLLDEYDRQHVGPPGMARKIIEEAPAVIEQKKGRWIPVDDPSITGRCSVCGFESHLCEDDVYGYNYCPDCGARLEVVDE